VIRRAAIHGRRIGLGGGLAPSVGAVVAAMGDAYPEIVDNRILVETTLRAEESAFERTLEAGADRLAALLDSGAGTIPGEEAFRLHDTYGLPIEVTMELAAERGVAVDRQGFDAAMAEQRARSKAAHVRVGFEGGPSLPGTVFVGYETLDSAATVVRIGADHPRERLTKGEEDAVILDTSPFYAEAGGQVGDTGELLFDGGRALVLDTTLAGFAGVHSTRVVEGSLAVGSTVHAVVDADRRARISRHHSATHFLNQALRETLGVGVVQRGSFVGPRHATFDFSFGRALTPAELRDIEGRVNQRIRSNLQRQVDLMSLPEARATGAIALLDERYSDRVRVVDFGGWSRELCGGTHVTRTGDVGAAIIVSESSIGQGVRRIEMVVGEAAERHWQETSDALQHTARALKAPAADVPARVTALQEQLRTTRRELEQTRRTVALPGAGAGTGGLDASPVDLGGGLRYVLLATDVDGDAVVEIADRLYAERLGGDGVAVAIGMDSFAIKAGTTARDRGLHAGDLASAAAVVMDGKGGGRPDFGRGGIRDPGKREQGMTWIRAELTRLGEGNGS
jgi:alanyl-tRNA synthetase